MLTSEKGQIYKSNIYRNLWKSTQVIYIRYPNCVYDIMILIQAFPKIFCSQAPLYKMPISAKGHNLAKHLQNIAKSKSGQLHIGHNLYTKYHYPNTRCSPYILFTMPFMGKIPASKKGNNSVKYLRNFMKTWSGHKHRVPKLISWY